MKNIFIKSIMLSAAIFIFSACTPEENKSTNSGNAATTAPEKAKIVIGLVDTEQIFSASLSGKAGIAHLEGIGKELQEDFIKLQSEMKEKDENAIMNFQNQAGKLEQRFKAEEQQVMTAIEKLYQESLDNVRKEQKIQMILAKNSALSFDESVDVTAKILENMDKTTLTFKALPVEKSIEAEEKAVEPAVKATNSSEAKSSPEKAKEEKASSEKDKKEKTSEAKKEKAEKK